MSSGLSSLLRRVVGWPVWTVYAPNMRGKFTHHVANFTHREAAKVKAAQGVGKREVRKRRIRRPDRPWTEDAR